MDQRLLNDDLNQDTEFEWLSERTLRLQTLSESKFSTVSLSKSARFAFLKLHTVSTLVTYRC